MYADVYLLMTYYTDTAAWLLTYYADTAAWLFTTVPDHAPVVTTAACPANWRACAPLSQRNPELLAAAPAAAPAPAAMQGFNGITIEFLYRPTPLSFMRGGEAILFSDVTKGSGNVMVALTTDALVWRATTVPAAGHPPDGRA